MSASSIPSKLLHMLLLQDAKQGHLVQHLPKNIGFGMGLEFREAINLLKPGNERKVAAGMVFNVAVGMLPHFMH